MLRLLNLIVLSLATVSCCSGRFINYSSSNTDISEVDSLPIAPEKEFILRKDYDLKGMCYRIPNNVKIKQGKGVFKNGTLIGQNTRIEGLGRVFKNVTIKGEWSVPVITISLFDDLAYENSLKDLFALASSKIHNDIIIESGDYYVSAESFCSAINIESNTNIILNCNIHLIPNDYSGCYILGVKNVSDIEISGNGTIEGDRKNHLGVKGEWGHGINIIASKNVTIKGLTVQNCWGDCIYVGGNSSDIIVKNSNINGGRRQGVSITSGDRIAVYNCSIRNIFGVEPQYAIDVEPNKGERVDNVIIEKVNVDHCFGAFLSWGGAKDSKIGTIIIKDCTVSNMESDYPIQFSIGDKLIVTGCNFETGSKPGLFTDEVNIVEAYDNLIKSTLGNSINIRRAYSKSVANNSIIK